MKTTVPIRGMHCRSCEILVGDNLKAINGVENVDVSFKKKTAVVHHLSKLDMDQVRAAISEAGYEVGNENPKGWLSRNWADYRELIDAAIVLMVLFFVLKRLGIFELAGSGSGNPSNLLVVLFIGLTAGISTCMALVGGLVLGMAARHSDKHPEVTALQKFRPHIFFNVGRIASYFLFGGLIGLAGKAFQFSGPTLGFLTIAVGFVMLFLGAQLIEIFPKLTNFSLSLPSGISKIVGLKKHHEKEYSHSNSLAVGALTFFLPCGFTQAMQLFAMSTGSFSSGALIMGTFAIGTAPGLLGVGGLTSIVKGSFAKKFFKFTGLLVIFLALFNISNGYNLTGWKKFTFFNTSSSMNANIENGVQVLRMKQSFNGYSPNSFTINKGVPVKLIVTSEDSNSCASVLLIPKLNINKTLKPGENIIEFTPKEVGEIRFSCIMGMFTGRFVVTDGELKLQGDQKNTQPSSSQSVTSRPVSGTQVVKTAYVSLGQDISPSEFVVSAGKPVQFEVEVKENGRGCMSTIMIPGLVDTPEYLEKGKTLSFAFTPKKGTYEITCAMGVPRGRIIAQ